MNHQYVIDRIEENTAALENQDGIITEIPAHWLPEGAREGHVLDVHTTRDNNKSTLELRINEEATKERADHAQNLRDALTKGPSGDITL